MVISNRFRSGPWVSDLAGGSALVFVYKVRMQDGAAARTDGVNIWIDDRLNSIEEWCAIVHELVHIERGEGTCQPEYIEMEVRYLTAQRLLPSITAIPCRGKDLAEVARNLGVTRRVLMDRAATLTRDQSIAAGCFTCLKCPSQAAKMREYVNAMVGEDHMQDLRSPRPYPQRAKSREPSGEERHPRMLKQCVVAA